MLFGHKLGVGRAEAARRRAKNELFSRADSHASSDSAIGIRHAIPVLRRDASGFSSSVRIRGATAIVCWRCVKL